MSSDYKFSQLLIDVTSRIRTEAQVFFLIIVVTNSGWINYKIRPKLRSVIFLSAQNRLARFALSRTFVDVLTMELGSIGIKTDNVACCCYAKTVQAAVDIIKITDDLISFEYLAIIQPLVSELGYITFFHLSW